MKKIFFLILIFSFQFIMAQTIEKKFVGCWADTFWIFEFHKNGKYERISTGHYGNTNVSGKYKMINDTIQLLSGFEKTHGTVNEYYIIDKNNVLIDLELEYGYVIYENENSGDECELTYPNITPVNKEKVIQLEKALNEAFNSKAMKKYYHFDTFPDRKLLITKYQELQANIIVDNIVAEFKPKEEITEVFFIEIEDLDMYYSHLNLKIKIHSENTLFRFHFNLVNDEWIIDNTIIIEE